MLSHLVPHYQKMSTFTFSDDIADNLLEPSEQVAQTNKSLQTLKNGKLTKKPTVYNKFMFIQGSQTFKVQIRINLQNKM
ncbi:hypothetical protein T06_7032 [Trichinella sp. T6]|nr:hypothetical protein T06_7032 [Trichinella sp. T6]